VLHVKGEFEVEKINGMFETVKAHFQTLDEKKAKLVEILGRYDEELRILRPAPPEGQANCPNCSTGYIPGEMLFCSKCGNKLPTEVASLTSEAIAESKSLTVCSNCNTPTVAGAAFCAHCGGKL